MKRFHSRSGGSGSSNIEDNDGSNIMAMAISLMECTKTYISELWDSDDSDDLMVPTLLDCASDMMNISTRKKRSCWKKSWRKERDEKGSFVFLTKELNCSDSDSFHNYLRMSNDTFELLLSLVGDKIQKQNTLMRDAISPKEKLAATLRYLATGETYQSTDFQTRLSKSFLCKAIPEVCSAIWDCLKDSYLHVSK